MSFETLDINVELGEATNFGAVTSFGNFISIPEIPVLARIVNIEVVDHKDVPGAKNTRFAFEVVEAPEYGAKYNGAKRSRILRNIDATEAGQNSRSGWKTALESVGYTEAQLDQTVAPKVKNFVEIDKETGKVIRGKLCHLQAKPKPPGAGKDVYDEVEFVTPKTYRERWAAIKADEGKGGSAAGSASAGRVSGPGKEEKAEKPAANIPAAKDLKKDLLD